MPPRQPRLKIVRRFGTQLPGLTRKDAERRPFPPGQHGAVQARRSKRSLFRKRLEEKQKVRYNYGVTERQLVRYMKRAQTMPGVTGHTFLAFLERRLDNIVFRLGFAPTIPAARQLVSHGHIRVNGARVDRPSYSAEIGDTITLSDRARERPSVQEMIARGPTVKIPSYLALDTTDTTQGAVGRVIQMPMRHDIPFIVDDASIVEFYAQ